MLLRKAIENYLLISARLARLIHGANDLDDGDKQQGGNDSTNRVQANFGKLEEWRFTGFVVVDVHCVWNMVEIKDYEHSIQKF